MEDDPVSASALLTILRRRGFDVLLATTVAEGMQLLEREPNFVVLDLMLPDGDGIAILNHIRRNSRDIRVLVTTAVSDPARLFEVRQLRPDLVLQKPIDLSDLLQMMGPVN